MIQGGETVQMSVLECGTCLAGHPVGFEGQGQRLRQRQMSHRRMLTVAMSSQVHLALESFVAETTGERLVTRVFAHVSDQVGRLAEGLAANDALVRLLSCHFVTDTQNTWIRDYLLL